ncbi:MAG: DHH family phosphoesterase [Candidatus Babeliales bacterium]
MNQLIQNESLSKDAIAQAWQLIMQAQKITLLTHKDPDGDCVSACAALDHLLTKLGKSVETIYPNKAEFDFKRQPKNIIINAHNQTPDLIIACDISVYARLYFHPLFATIPLINIDHHVCNAINGTVNLVSQNSSSTCEDLFLIIHAWDEKLVDRYVAECLLAGLLSDSQIFQTNAVTPRTLHIAALLMERGADLFTVKAELTENRDVNIIAFWGQLLGNITITPDKKAAWIAISQEDLRQQKLTLTSLVGFSNFLSQLSGIDITMVFYENEKGETQASIRSKQTDVNALARHFGGGGHVNAAGITSDKPLKQLVAQVLEKI